MVHIQQGNQRQYISGEIEQVGQLEQVASQLFNAVPQSVNIVQQANESKLANNQVDLSTQYLAKNNEINTKYQSDPTNPQREVELKEAFDNLADKYNVHPLVQGQWNQIKNNIYNNYKEYNAQWQLKQQQTNATNDLKNGYESLTNQISMLGMNGASVEEVRLLYKNGIDGLRKSAIAVLGAVTAQQFLKDFNHDLMSTYISALAVNNPLQAQLLMKDKGVLNDIGNAETIDKLNNYISASLSNQNKKVAVQEIGNTLRAMKSEDAKNILDGRANLNQVMKFIETNKNLPEGSKDFVLNIYGLKSKTDYYYDKDKQKIVKKEQKSSGGSGGSGGSLVALSKLSKEEKVGIADNLEMKLNEMFFFDDTEFETVKPKKGNQSNVVQRMQNLAQMQGAIDTAYSAGIITKAQRQDYMNKFIEPMTSYLEANMSELDEKSGLGIIGNKLGYDKIKKAFPIEGSKSNKLAHQKDLLTAQGYYYQALDTARKKYGLSSVYDIEKLHSKDQQDIYKTASENAINYAKRNSQHPELFFKQEYPLLYQQGVKMFGIKDGNAVAKRVATKIYNANEGEKINVKEVMGNAISDMHALKQNKNLQTKLKLYEEKNTVQKPNGKGIVDNNRQSDFYVRARKDYNEKLNKYNASITQRKKALNISDSDLKQTMKESGLTESQVLSLLEMQKKGLTLADLYED